MSHFPFCISAFQTKDLKILGVERGAAKAELGHEDQNVMAFFVFWVPNFH